MRASRAAPPLALRPSPHHLILAAILGGSSGRQGAARPSGGVENRTAPRRVERSLSLPGSAAARTPHAPRTHPVRTPCTSRAHPAPALCPGLQERSLRLAMCLKMFGSRGQAGGHRGMPNCTMEGGLGDCKAPQLCMGRAGRDSPEEVPGDGPASALGSGSLFVLSAGQPVVRGRRGVRGSCGRLGCARHPGLWSSPSAALRATWDEF